MCEALSDIISTDFDDLIVVKLMTISPRHLLSVSPECPGLMEILSKQIFLKRSTLECQVPFCEIVEDYKVLEICSWNNRDLLLTVKKKDNISQQNINFTLTIHTKMIIS